MIIFAWFMIGVAILALVSLVCVCVASSPKL